MRNARDRENRRPGRERGHPPGRQLGDESLADDRRTVAGRDVDGHGRESRQPQGQLSRRRGDRPRRERDLDGPPLRLRRRRDPEPLRHRSGHRRGRAHVAAHVDVRVVALVQMALSVGACAHRPEARQQVHVVVALRIEVRPQQSLRQVALVLLVRGGSAHATPQRVVHLEGIRDEEEADRHGAGDADDLVDQVEEPRVALRVRRSKHLSGAHILDAQEPLVGRGARLQGGIQVRHARVKTTSIAPQTCVLSSLAKGRARRQSRAKPATAEPIATATRRT